MTDQHELLFLMFFFCHSKIIIHFFLLEYSCLVLDVFILIALKITGYLYLRKILTFWSLHSTEKNSSHLLEGASPVILNMKCAHFLAILLLMAAFSMYFHVSAIICFFFFQIAVLFDLFTVSVSWTIFFWLCFSEDTTQLLNANYNQSVQICTEFESWILWLFLE